MDSLTHVVFGAAVGTAVMGRRTAAWKAAAWGALCNTLPDLDVFVRHGDPVLDMTLHRGPSHALFWLTLLSPIVTACIAAWPRERALAARWWLASWLALVTHPLLDLFTVYGTQLLRPFEDAPRGIGSIFILDPCLTLPLLACVVIGFAMRSPAGLRVNAIGLVFVAAYLAAGVIVQRHVETLAERALRQRGIADARVMATPAPFSIVLWRIVAITPDGRLHEGFHSLLDTGDDIVFDAFPRGQPLYEALRDVPAVARIAAFSHGWFKMDERDGEATITDLRMGQEPAYSFTFAVARREGDRWVTIAPRSAGSRGDMRRLMGWLGPRLLGQPAPPPR